ncbi:MAG: SymE family type I addiction module toxin [Oliverpabstia sp.]|nr:SymE family type I addiction module toxin [Oliverpabstia sp.]
MTNKTNRKLTISEASGCYSSRRKTPKLTLQGIWMENLGFHIGDRVNVTCNNNQLIIESIPAENSALS